VWAAAPFTKMPRSHWGNRGSTYTITLARTQLSPFIYGSTVHAALSIPRASTSR
jgi:hypothetical protein